MSDYLHAFDEVARFGDPWHGLVLGATLTLPGGITKPLPGAVPTGGDCYLVQAPGMPAVTTSADEVAQGMTWLNHGLMSGPNHCLYGQALGADSWVYVTGAGVAWLCKMAFNVATRSGSVTFRRFGVFPDDGAGVVQTATFSLPGPFDGSAWQIDDIKPDGSGVLVVTYEPVDSWTFYNIQTTGHRRCGGAFEVIVSGSPPAASVAAAQLKTASQASGQSVDTRAYTHATVNGVSIVTSNVGRVGHFDRLAGYCYSAGAALPVLRSLWSDQESYSSPSAPSTSLVDYTVNGQADHYYKVSIGSQALQITGRTSWAGSGQVEAGSYPPPHLSGNLTHTTTLDGHAGYTYTFSGPTVVSYQAADSWIFTEAGDTDNYFIAAASSGPTVAIWPRRLGNGLYGIARYQRNLATGDFAGTWLTGIVHPGGTVAVELSSTNTSTKFYATRHPVTGDIQTRASDDGTRVCWR